MATREVDRGIRRNDYRRKASCQLGAAFFSKPYDDLSITEAMARLLDSDDPKATSL